jgi:hypothetical protein
LCGILRCQRFQVAYCRSARQYAALSRFKSANVA